MRLKRLLVAASLALAVLASGCAYRADLVQGNYVEQESIDQLRYGMTREQVRFVLGTPMLTDPFDNSRWYYVHFKREGWSDPKIQNLILLFNNNFLVDIHGDYEKPLYFNSQEPVKKIDL